MASLPEFDDNKPDYIRWIKAGLVLRQLKDGLVGFLDREMRQVHADILTSVRSQLSQNASLECKACTTKQLQKPRYKCPNDVCSLMFKKIENFHQFEDPKLKNTDLTMWCDSKGSWEVAKCFLPDGYTSIKTPADTDCTGLLSLVINCRDLYPKMSENLIRQPNRFTQVRDRRNTVMHSSNLCLSTSDLTQLVKDALAILNDSKCLKQDPDAQTAANNIVKIHKDTLDISLKDELAVLEETKHALRESQKLSELRIGLEEQMQKQKDDFEAKLTGEMGQLETKHGTHHQELVDLKLETEKMQNRTEQQLSTLESAIHNARTKAAALEADVQVIKTQVQCLTEDTANLHTDVTGLATDARCMEADIRDLAKETQVLESRVGSLEGRRMATVSQSPPDDVNFKKDLVDKYRDILTTLQVSKWNKKLKIDDIFTPIIIREDLEKQLAESSRCPINSHLQTERKEPKRITSYDEVFLKDKEKQTDIYMIGKAGIGKSLFILQLVNLWCKVQIHDPTSLIEMVLRKFDYVFYVSCRCAKRPKLNEQWDSLKDLILKQNCLGNKRYERFVQQMLESGTKNCLVLIDGLDEWGAPASEISSPLGRPGLPDREGLYNCVYLTTSRPWRIEALPNGVGQSCRVVEIIGLDKEGVEGLTRNLLKALEERDPDAAVESFLKDIQNQKMNEIAKIPLMLANVVVSWHDNGHRLDRSICLNYSGMMESLINRAGLGPSMEETATDGQPGAGLIHPCFKARAKCCLIWSLIMKLSDLAFHSLLGQDRERFLVFDKLDLARRLGEADLETCLKIGILSQTEAISGSVACMVTISFLHKSVQEFLAALFMCGEEFERCLEIFVAQCKTLEDVFDFQLIITFLCGLAPDKGSRLLQSIQNLVEEDERIKLHRLDAVRASKDTRHNDSVKVVVQFQELALDCAREASLSVSLSQMDKVTTGSWDTIAVFHNPLDYFVHVRRVFIRFFRRLCCRHISSSADADYTDVIGALRELLEDNGSRFQRVNKMFVLSDVYLDLDVHGDVYEFLINQSIANPREIKSLVYADEVNTPLYIVPALISMCMLERLQVTCSVEKANSYLVYVREALPSLHLLKSLGFHIARGNYTNVHVPLLTQVGDMVITFNRSANCSSLYLYGVDTEAKHASTLGLPIEQPEWSSPPVQALFPQTFTTLSSLDLRAGKMSHNHLQDLCACLKTSVSLQILMLWRIDCNDCARGECGYNLDLLALQHLTTLKLGHLDVSSVKVGSEVFEAVSLRYLREPGDHQTVVTCLPQSPRLSRLHISGLRDKAAISTLVKTLPKLSQLDEVLLHDIAFDYYVIDTSRMERLREIDFSSVTMTARSWWQFINYLPRHEVDVVIEESDIDEDTKYEIQSSPHYNIIKWQDDDAATLFIRFLSVP